MFKKVQKKNKALVLDNDLEEKIDIKPKIQKKKMGKWIDVPLKNICYTTEDINLVINQEEKPDEDINKDNAKIQEEFLPIVYGYDFNESVDQLAKVMTHKGEIESSNPEDFSSEEELKEIELSSESEDNKWSYTIGDQEFHGSFQSKTPEITITTLQKFLNEKLCDIKACKEMNTSRLRDIINIKENSKKALEILVSNKK